MDLKSSDSISVAFADRQRAWADLVVGVERGDGRLLVPTDAPAKKGDEISLIIHIADDPALEVGAHIERIRRPSPRFARGIVLRLSDEARREIRDRLGQFSGDATPSFGRRAPRFSLHWPVQFRTPALSNPVDARDISADGMHIEMPERVEPGDVVEFTLFTPQGHALFLAGEVQWTSEVSDKVGVRFLYRDDDERELMRALLLHAVGAQLSNVGQAMVLVIGDEARLTRGLSKLAEMTPLPLRFVTRREDALATVRHERPRVLLLPHDDAELNALCASIAEDAELVGTQVVIFAPDDHDGDVTEIARRAGAHLAVTVPIRTDVASSLLEGLLPWEEPLT